MTIDQFITIWLFVLLVLALWICDKSLKALKRSLRREKSFMDHVFSNTSPMSIKRDGSNE